MDAWQALDIARRLRAADRMYLAGQLHDRPIQDLAAAALELSVARRTAGTMAGDEFDVVERLVEEAGRELRSIMDEIGYFSQPEPDLATALAGRTARLLAAPARPAVHRASNTPERLGHQCPPVPSTSLALDSP